MIAKCYTITHGAQIICEEESSLVLLDEEEEKKMEMPYNHS